MDNENEILQEGSEVGSEMKTPTTPTRMFPTWGDLAMMLAIFFGSTVVSAGLMIALMTVCPNFTQEPLTAIVYTIQFSLTIVGILLYRRKRGGEGRVFHFRLQWYNASFVIVGLILMTAASVALEPILSLFPDEMFELLNNAIGSGGWAIVTTVLLAPVLEEMLFRGLILESIKQKRGATAAVMLSALLFGLVHFPILPQMLNAFVMGVMLGYVYVLTNSLVAVIIIHAANNALSFLFMEITDGQQVTLNGMLDNELLYWIIYGVSVVVFIGAVSCMALAAAKNSRKVSNKDKQVTLV
jgi:membrane protease YdiL (CAAX protease family)